MKVDLTAGKLTAWLGIPAALAGAFIAWDLVGWMSPNAHEEDIVQMEAEHESVNTAILIQLKVNRDEWWCDEESEYLDELITYKDAGDTSEALQQEMNEQRVKLEATECHRFDKD